MVVFKHRLSKMIPNFDINASFEKARGNEPDLISFT